MRDSARLLLGLCSLLGAASACKRAETQAAPAQSSAPAPLPLDHLAPDELAPGKVEVYGFPVPRGMEVQAYLADRAYVVGHVSPEALANYVREQLVVSHVEIGAARTVFPMARIKAGPADRVFTLEVVPDGPNTGLVIKDTTPLPPPAPGLTDAERWRAAGLTPDGKPLDMQKLE